MENFVYIVFKTYIHDHCGPEIHAIYADPTVAIDERSSLQKEAEFIRKLSKTEKEKIPFEDRLIENYNYEIEKWEVY